jgi:hypothetical protein
MTEFSILIPTRNRQASARLAIESALAEDGVDAEVLAADNSDTPLAMESDDRRLRILPPEGVLSMPANWERAIRNARGEWLVLLSDKCRLVRGALPVLRALAGSEHKVVTYCRSTFVQDLSPESFERPDHLAESPGSLIHPSRPFIRVLRNSKAVLNEWFANVDYTVGYRPMLYSALIHRSIVDHVLEKYPTFLVGMAPDVASGLSVLGGTVAYLDTNLPATLMQFPSRNFTLWSNGFALAWGTRLGRKYLSEFGADPLDRYKLPPTGAAVVAQTLLEFQRLRRDEVPAGTDLNWLSFALIAAHEIERYPPQRRYELHTQLFRALYAVGAKVAWVQVRALMVSRMPRLYRIYKSFKRSRTQVSYPITTADLRLGQNAVESPVESLHGALAILRDEVRGASWRDSPQESPPSGT